MKIHLLGADDFSVSKEGDSDMTKLTVSLRKFTSKRQILEQRNDLYIININFAKMQVSLRTWADEPFLLLFKCSIKLFPWRPRYYYFTGDIDLSKRHWCTILIIFVELTESCSSTTNRTNCFFTTTRMVTRTHQNVTLHIHSLCR